MISCIYKIVNRKNDSIYVGSAKNFNKRKKLHIKQLKNGKHHSRYLQAAWNKYGESSFDFAIIEECSESLLIEREQYYLNILCPEYNICRIAGSSAGIKRTKEFKDKLRRANQGLKHPDWRNKIKSESQGGDKHWTNKRRFTEGALKKKSDSMKVYHSNNPSVRKVAVIKCDLLGNELEEFDSVTKAAGGNEVVRKSITNCLTNKQKTAKGYKWKYKTN